ncbi:dynamin family protein [Membranicola marinus]|uniref:Dynamin family protein n=1 Tax=Membranihabitans marinus TaxID=1227546 RepID=A0A953HQ49_9BACT|nr:dynamin family protein [Membranihabitans marinus]MBY5958793.1 dynamin family protein [Membranihabitans marinus]
MAALTEKKLLPYFERIKTLVDKLAEQSSRIDNSETLSTIQELRLRMDEPFLFVIVGEVKAGKSSFINALLSTDEEICAVAPDPKTDTIQQIKYGDVHDEVIINEFLKQIYFPDPILQEISIVDTPGTNTIVEHHQEITERFVPVSDLVVFVFEAKNPYRKSAWDFLSFINQEWKKKVIFVLQQKDLLNENDLQINLEGVRKEAAKHNVPEPHVFAVSALQELEGNHDLSGYPALRKYLKENITGIHAFRLKIENLLELVTTLNEKINAGLKARQAQYESDLLFRKEIDKTLHEHVLKSQNQVQTLIHNLLTGYDKATMISERELRDGLSFFRLVGKSFKSIFNKNESPQVWLSEIKTDLDKNLKIEMTDRLHEGVSDLADNIQNMAKVVELKILKNKTILKDNDELFGHIAERRRLIIEELQESFHNFIRNSENFVDTKLVEESSSISPNLATGSGIAVVGIILTAVTNGAVFDITGGLITGIGLLFAGITTGIKRGKILRRFSEEIKLTRSKIENELTLKLNEYIQQIKDKIETQFIEFDQLLEEEGKELQLMQENYNHIDSEQKTIRKKLAHL